MKSLRLDERSISNGHTNTDPHFCAIILTTSLRESCSLLEKNLLPQIEPEIKTDFGTLHLPVYTFFEKACIVELNADVETGNSKLGNASTSLYFSNFKFPISNFTAKTQDQ